MSKYWLTINQYHCRRSTRITMAHFQQMTNCMEGILTLLLRWQSQLESATSQCYKIHPCLCSETLKKFKRSPQWHPPSSPWSRTTLTSWRSPSRTRRRTRWCSTCSPYSPSVITSIDFRSDCSWFLSSCSLVTLTHPSISKSFLEHCFRWFSIKVHFMNSLPKALRTKTLTA